MNYLRAKPPTQPNFNVDKEVACEAVEYYRDQATMKSPAHPALQNWLAHRVKTAD